MLIVPTTIVTMNPTTGPLKPRSNSWSRLVGGPFSEMRAPKVPMGGGPGMKYGKLASSPWTTVAALAEFVKTNYRQESGSEYARFKVGTGTWQDNLVVLG